MRSNKSMLLLSFGVLFLAFGGVILFLLLLGIQFDSRESFGSPGILGLVFVLIGGALYGGGFAMGNRDDHAP